MAFQRLSGIGHRMTHEVLPRVAAVGLAVGLCTMPEVIDAVEAKSSLDDAQSKLVGTNDVFLDHQDVVVDLAQELTKTCYAFLRQETPHGLDSQSTLDAVSGIASDDDSLGPCGMNSGLHLTAVEYLVAQYKYEQATTELAVAYHVYATTEETWEQAPRQIKRSALQGLFAIVAFSSIMGIRRIRTPRRRTVQPLPSNLATGTEQAEALKEELFDNPKANE